MPLVLKSGGLLYKDGGLAYIPAGGDPCVCCYECGPQSFASGGGGYYEKVHNLQPFSGYMTLSWNAYRVPDRFRVEVNGVVIFDSGVVSGSGSHTFCRPTGAQVKVIVDGSPGGTAWDYTLTCPDGSAC